MIASKYDMNHDEVWFRVYSEEERACIMSSDDADIGRAFMAANSYYNTGKEAEGLTPAQQKIYDIFKDIVDNRVINPDEKWIREVAYGLVDED